MIDRRLKNVRPKDFFFVLLYGLALPYAFGIVAGFVDYYVSAALPLPISVGSMLYWIVAMYCGGVIRKQYEDPHLLYAIVAGFGMLLSAIVIYTVPIVLTIALANGGSRLQVFNPLNYLYYATILFNPLLWVLNFSFPTLLWILSIAIGTYLGVRKTVQRIY